MMKEPLTEKEKKVKNLMMLTDNAKTAILECLRKSSGPCKRLELEEYVISLINCKVKQDGEITHWTKPVHHLAFILAYKQLESEGLIDIQRSGIPFPMTDSETIISLGISFIAGRRREPKPAVDK